MDPEIPLFVVCLLLSALFSGSETALLSTSRLRLRRLAGEGDRKAAHILELVQNPRKLLAGILVGNNIANVLAASTATAFCVGIFGEARGVALASAISAVILILFCEYLPKTIAASHPIRSSKLVLAPLKWVLVAFSPLIVPLEMMTRPIARLTRSRTADRFGLADVRTAVSEGVRSGAVDETVERVLHGGLSLRSKVVADVMVPRVDVQGVASSCRYDDCLRRFRETPHSRLLVMDETPDKDMGYLAMKDLLTVPDDERPAWSAADGARDLLRFPESLPLTDALVRMQSSGAHFAIVKDEYGGTEGIVTLEDVLEELVGEIRDETDEAEMPAVREAGRDLWLVRAECSLKELEDRLGVKLETEEARTVGGFVATRLGRVPKLGDVVREERVKLQVERLRARRVLEVRIRRIPSKRADDDE